MKAERSRKVATALLILAGIVVSVLGLSLAGVDAGELNPTNIVVEGSTTVGPIAKAFAEYYMKLHPDVNIVVSESGSGNGAKALINNGCDVADMSRFMKAKEFKAAVANGVLPVAQVVAMDGIAISVHPANPVKALTVAQVRDIFAGRITNWKALGGPDMKILRISRDTNSGTFEAFNGLVMKKDKIAEGTETVGSNGQMRARISQTRSAIGYLGLGFVDAKTKALEIDGVKPNGTTVSSGRYPISRPLFMFTNGYPKIGSHLHAFVTLYLTKKGQEMVARKGYVPVTKY
ncbi:MAG: phosphate ABC transporter substrate-binding protein PstS family protein [Anaerolineaceae bacterium]|nr:phosphate ABC transporter substrate-binding protein PstS family protein [Anaerolineaceae bacterium]